MTRAELNRHAAKMRKENRIYAAKRTAAKAAWERKRSLSEYEHRILSITVQMEHHEAMIEQLRSKLRMVIREQFLRGIEQPTVKTQPHDAD